MITEYLRYFDYEKLNDIVYEILLYAKNHGNGLCHFREKLYIHTVFIKQKLLNADIKDTLFIMPWDYFILYYNDLFK